MTSAASEETLEATAGPVRVAVVDDHRLVLDGLAAHISIRHPDIAVVTTETSWGDLLGHPEFPVDVVVLDLGLGDGIPIATKIRTLKTAGVRTVVMSRHADAHSIQAATRAGAHAFVPKSDDACELVRAIRCAATGMRFERDTDDTATTTGPRLGKQEQRALTLYATGRTIGEVAEKMGTTEETVKSYIKRARRKYRTAGLDIGTRALLRRHAVSEGWVSAE